MNNFINFDKPPQISIFQTKNSHQIKINQKDIYEIK